MLNTARNQISPPPVNKNQNAINQLAGSTLRAQGPSTLDAG